MQKKIKLNILHLMYIILNIVTDELHRMPHVTRSFLPEEIVVLYVLKNQTAHTL